MVRALFATDDWLWHKNTLSDIHCRYAEVVSTPCCISLFDR